jgi:hypothetical protein
LRRRIYCWANNLQAPRAVCNRSVSAKLQGFQRVGSECSNESEEMAWPRARPRSTWEEGSRPVSRVLSRVIIPLGRPSPCASSSLPGSHARTRRCRLPCDFPIWPCSRWGLPCHACYHPRGALLPHHFTLTCASAPCGAWARRRYLSVALSVGSRPPGVTWHRVRKSPDFPPHFTRNAATTRPAPAREDTRRWQATQMNLGQRRGGRTC